MKKIHAFLAIFIFSISVPIQYSFQNIMDKTSYTYLALGDSYTIGESVPSFENFPNTVVRQLKKEGFDFKLPEIVAKTGWTTDELQAAITKQKLKPPYDFVTLLIGVNNQYRGRHVENYKPEF